MTVRNAKKTTKKAKSENAAAITPAVSKKPRFQFDWPWRWQLQPKEPVRQFPKLPSVWKLTDQTARTLWEQKYLLGGIVGVYAALNLLLVQSFASPTGVTNFKSHLGQLFHGHSSQLLGSTTAFTQLLGSASSGSSQSGSVYEFFLVIMSSLAVIWALRQIQAGMTPRIRESFYRGMYPIVPFILVLLVIGLDLVPMLIGSAVYGIVVSNGIAVFWYEQVLWSLVAALGIVLSLYLAMSALFALYVTTLPDMNPMTALRSARPLVRGRRWPVICRVLYLPIALLIVGFVIMAPIAIMFAPIARMTLFVLTALSIGVINTYLYTLYRELLSEKI